MANNILIYNALLYGSMLEPGTRGRVLIDGDTIAEVGTGEPIVKSEYAIDAQGAMLLPGLIDTHVHFREPGLTHKGDIATESAAAIVGGITSYIEMPNTVPATTTAATFADKLARAAGRSYANYGFMLGASDGVVDAINAIDPSSLPAVKLFMGTTTGGMAMPEAAQLDAMLRLCAERRIPVVVHAEDNDIIAANAAAAVEKYGDRAGVPIGEHHLIRSREACISCTRQAIELARKYGVRLHIAHVSTAEEAELISAEKAEIKGLTAETTPMYLCVEPAPDFTTTWRIKINPAVKGAQPALIQAVANGIIDTLATDHAPHLRSEKEGGALTAASGAPSVQFALPMLLNVLTPTVIAERMAAAPARLFGIESRGRLVPGFAADIVMVSKCEPYTITDADVISPCGWTPFDGRVCTHRVDRVWLNGRLAAANGRTVGSPAGKPLIFK